MRCAEPSEAGVMLPMAMATAVMSRRAMFNQAVLASYPSEASRNTPGPLVKVANCPLSPPDATTTFSLLLRT